MTSSPELREKRVDKLVLLVARASGLVGVALTLFAVLARLAGFHILGRFESATLLDGGMAAMLLASLAYAYLIAEARVR
jgi:hypothetical protein